MSEKCILCGTLLRKNHCINPNCIAGISSVINCASKKDGEESERSSLSGSHTLSYFGLDKDWKEEFKKSKYLGYVYKIDDSNYRIFCEPTWQDSGMSINETTHPILWSYLQDYLINNSDKIITSYNDPTWRERSKIKKLMELKQYLSDTDYTVTKIAEAAAEGEDTTELIAEYKDIIEKRKQARQEINELENS